MLEEYIFKTIIAFVSINALCYVFQDDISYLSNKNTKKPPRIKRLINGFLVSAVPFARWIFVGLVLFVAIVGTMKKGQDEQKEVESDEETNK